MSKEEWEEEHEFLKPKHGNYRGIPNIYNLPAWKKKRLGLVIEDDEEQFVPLTLEEIEALEKEVSDRLMQEHIEREKRFEFLKGRRLQDRYFERFTDET